MSSVTIPAPRLSFLNFLNGFGDSLKLLQKEKATLDIKLQEAICTHDDTTHVLEGDLQSNKTELIKHEGDIKKLWKSNKAKSVAAEKDSAKIYDLEVSLTSMKNAYTDLVTECKDAAAEVAQRIQSGDTSWPRPCVLLTP